jgi:hypothetical protein
MKPKKTLLTLPLFTADLNNASVRTIRSFNWSELTAPLISDENLQVGLS